MGKYYQLGKEAWDDALSGLTCDHRVYAPLVHGESQDYELIDKDLVRKIVYNVPKPSTPLKIFLLPVKENVSAGVPKNVPVIILGVPGCDLFALDLLDAFYLDEEYPDLYYAQRRQEFLLIGTDCHFSDAHCHCTSYGLNPYPSKNQDMGVSLINDKVWLSVYTEKGGDLLKKIQDIAPVRFFGEDVPAEMEDIRQKVRKEIEANNRRLPNYQETTHVVMNAAYEKWERHVERCVSCGACAAICPTCTCFLLIDRQGFEKIRQLDACQYPGFERVAGGEDPLKKMDKRFRNRYFCKYLYRPEKYEAIACTGCGRCITACIGDINKNELLTELTNDG